jgi:predicted PurR-regulated permease PerM
MKSVTGYLLTKFGAAVGGVTSVLITSLLVTIFLYFLLKHGEDWVRWLAALIPLDPVITTNLFQTAHQSIVANVNGVLAVAAAQGLSLSIGFWFVGVRSPVVLGLLSGVASVTPVVGAPLVWVPIVIVFVFMGSYWKALILGLWGALVAGSLDNIVRPLVVGANGKQHMLLVGLAMIGGTYAFGAIGILLGPLILSLAFALVEEIQKLVSPSTDGNIRQEGEDKVINQQVR